ncbi:MAG: hypothetical protein SFU21_17320 [Flavihumibacter sp.]|nr:hypothetical protein [Flavihumibacter sp.]
MILKYIFIGLGLYILYRLVFNVVIPVYKTTRHIRGQFKNMKERMEQEMQNQGYTNQTPKPAPASGKPTPGDYIDFEEVK